MARVASTIPNLINGVSQQPPAIRLQTQAELQLNCFSTVVEGLKKRPPTLHKAKLEGITDIVPTATALSHLINRDKSERYNVFIYKTATGANLKVFDLDGNEKTVTFPNGKAYLNHSADLQGTPFRTLTLADKTLIVNQTVTVGQGPQLSPTRPKEALINVISGNYGRSYEIKINNQLVARYETPNGENAKQTPGVDTMFIAKRLKDGSTKDLQDSWTWKTTDRNLDASGINTANGWDVRYFGSTLYIGRPDGQDFSIDIEDGFGGRAMIPAKGTIQNFSDLPRYAVNGVVMEISNSEGTESDNYFVVFESDGTGSNKGLWRETTRPGVRTRLDPATMPHILERNANGTFTFQRADWDPRLVGDDNTCPFPSFTDSTITDMFFFKNRLAFLSGEGLIMSKNGDYYDFFRTTLTQLLDDDPIDIEAGHNKVSILRDAIPFQDRVMVFSSQSQFQMKGNETLTPKTASMRAVTEFESSSLAKVVSAGKYLYFPVDRGTYTMIREYNFDGQTEIGDAQDVTSHVPQYIPGKVHRMDASSHEDVLVCATRQEKNKLYVYKYFWADERKLQSAWSVWSLPGVEEIVTFSFFESELILFLRRADGYYIETIAIHPGAKDIGSNFVNSLDRRAYVEGPHQDIAYNPYSDQTTLSIPYDAPQDLVVVTSLSSKYTSENLEGQPVQIVSRSGKRLVLQGDYRNTPLYVGLTYESRYRFSPIYIRKESSGGGMTTETKGRLQLTYVQVQYADTAYFLIEVTPQSRPTQRYYFNGRVLGDPSNVIGKTALMNGSFKFPVMSRNDRVTIDIVNDSYLPFSAISAEWFGTYSPKARSI